MGFYDEIEEYIRNTWNNTNIGQNRAKYIDPNVSRKIDTETPYAGYAPNNDLKTIYINPNRVRDQMNMVGTYAHEMAHTKQPISYRLLDGALGTPGWQLRNLDFPYYDSNQKSPPSIEVAAALVENEALARPGTRWYGTTPGKDVMDQLSNKYQYGRQRSGFTREQLQGQVEELLYPTGRYIRGPQGKRKGPSRGLFFYVNE